MKHIAIALAPWRRPHLKWVMLGFRHVAARKGWRLTPLYLSTWMGSDPWDSMTDPIQGMIAGDAVDSLPKVLQRSCAKVLVGPLGCGHGVPCVTHDFEAIARMGVQHLSSSGYRHLMFFCHGDPNRWDTEALKNGFAKAATDHQISATIFTTGPRTASRGHWVLTDQIADLADGMRRLGKPLGMLCFDDEHAYRALQACEKAGLRVPDDVAVLGIGDDEFVCEFADPTLSSISLNHERVGKIAAERLDFVTDGKAVVMETVVQPIGVTQRESTGFVPVEDADVRVALRLIRDRLDEPLTVDELAAEVNVSSRTLLRKFKAALGRTPGETVRQIRIDEARRLIASTDLPFQHIAARTGLGAASQFSHAIKAATGLTPGEMRRGERQR